MADDVAYLVSAWKILRDNQYLSTASSTIVVFEWLRQLPDEIEYVWKRKWTHVTALYALTRYLVLAETALTMIFYFREESADCPSVGKAQSWIMLFQILVVEVILTLRTYAIYNESKRILYSLLGLLTVIAAVDCWMVNRVVNGLRYGEAPFLGIKTCWIVTLDKLETGVVLGLVVFYELVIVGMTVWQGYHFYMRGTEPSVLIRILYRDGFMFCMLNCATSAADFLYIFLSPPQFHTLLNFPAISLHSLVGAWIILNLRGAAHAPSALTSPFGPAEPVEMLKFRTVALPRNDGP